MSTEKVLGSLLVKQPNPTRGAGPGNFVGWFFCCEFSEMDPVQSMQGNKKTTGKWYQPPKKDLVKHSEIRPDTVEIEFEWWMFWTGCLVEHYPKFVETLLVWFQTCLFQYCWMFSFFKKVFNDFQNKLLVRYRWQVGLEIVRADQKLTTARIPDMPKHSISDSCHEKWYSWSHVQEINKEIHLASVPRSHQL